MHSRLARLARGWIVGGFATLVAALGHSLAGGGAPSALAIASGLWFGGTLGTLLVARGRPSLPRTAIVVGASQLAFHLLFSLLGDGGSATVTGSHHQLAVAFSPGAAHAHSDGGMWLAHAAAAVATTAFLARAEAALWRMLVRVVRHALLVPAAVPVRQPRAARPAAPDSPAPARVFVPTAPRRGPPAFSFA